MEDQPLVAMVLIVSGKDQHQLCMHAPVDLDQYPVHGELLVRLPWAAGRAHGIASASGNDGAPRALNAFPADFGWRLSIE